MKTTILSRLLGLIVFFSFIVLPVYSQQKEVFEGSWEVVRHSFKETGEELAILGKYLNISEGNYVTVDTFTFNAPFTVTYVTTVIGPDTISAMDTIYVRDTRKRFSICHTKYKKTSENSLHLDQLNGIKKVSLKYYAKDDTLFFERKHASGKTVLMGLRQVSPTDSPVNLLSVFQNRAKGPLPLCGMWNRTDVYDDIKQNYHIAYNNSFLLVGDRWDYILFDSYGPVYGRYGNKLLIVSCDGEHRIDDTGYYFGTYGKIKRVDGDSFLDGENKKIYTSYSKPSIALLVDSDKVEEWTRTYEAPEFFKPFAQRLVPSIDIDPEFPGGMNACMHYIASSLKYPPTCQEQGIQGRVVVSFTVGEDGAVRDVANAGGNTTNQELIAEAIRIFKSMPAWTPGYKDGKPVAVKLTLPVNFRLW